MPPDIDDLPEPNKNVDTVLEVDDNNFKESLSSKVQVQKTTSQTSATLKESIMKKLSNNGCKFRS